MYTACDIASYFLSWSSPEMGDYISTLKLQKLCYYAQGFHLALYDKPLFEDNIEAWQYGPVIPTLYQTYKEDGDKGIDPAIVDKDHYPPHIRELLDDVFETYGQFSAWRLCTMVWEEPPWKDVYGIHDHPISHESMYRYFTTLLLPDAKNAPMPQEHGKDDECSQTKSTSDPFWISITQRGLFTGPPSPKTPAGGLAPAVA